MKSPQHLNHLGQPVGFPLDNWTVPPWPERVSMQGRFCLIEPLDPSRHAAELYEANSLDRDDTMWTYLPYGPFPTFESYNLWLTENAKGNDPFYYTIIDPVSRRAVGLASYLRITPASGSIEVGHLHFSPRLQKTPGATEAMFLMMRYAFGLGYRRYEWKCDLLNAKSKAAALRFGFCFEGIFRQATVYRNRNRDTAWFSVIDQEWPELERLFQDWLSPGNFDKEGKQLRSLSEMTATLAALRSSE